MASAAEGRFSVFVKRPWLKLILGLLSVALAVWMGYAAALVFQGTQLSSGDVLGWYTCDDGTSMHLMEAKGSLLKGEDSSSFSYTFDRGLLDCSDSAGSFSVRCLGGGLCYLSRGNLVFARL